MTHLDDEIVNAHSLEVGDECGARAHGAQFGRMADEYSTSYLNRRLRGCVQEVEKTVMQSSEPESNPYIRRERQSN